MTNYTEFLSDREVSWTGVNSTSMSVGENSEWAKKWVMWHGSDRVEDVRPNCMDCRGGWNESGRAAVVAQEDTDQGWISPRNPVPVTGVLYCNLLYPSCTPGGKTSPKNKGLEFPRLTHCRTNVISSISAPLLCLSESAPMICGSNQFFFLIQGSQTGVSAESGLVWPT
jgi:hypothetical protein